MSQTSPIDYSAMSMHPNGMFYANMGPMDGLQDPTMGFMADSSMTGMVTDYHNMSMPPFDVNNLQDQSRQRSSYEPKSPALSYTREHSVQDEDSLAIDMNTNDVPKSGVGAGPLPTGFGSQSLMAMGSTLTDFTKRRNWPQKAVEELRDFLHILTPDGRILYTSPSGKALTGYSQEELVNKFIVDFIHPDDSGIFIREFNESIASGNQLRFFYRFRKQDGTYTIFESHGHPHLTSDAATFGPNNAASFCRGFFMMARPYPTKNAGLLDSFLEHKIENVRLMRRIADLKREEAEESEEQHRHWLKRQENRSDVTPSEDTELGTSVGTGPRKLSLDILAMPPPAKPSSFNTALTRQNLEDANASNKPDSINDKMARFEGPSIEAIEMFTGLRYQDGERSKGISTGAESPSLIRGDIGVEMPMDKDPRAGDKKKKIKVADEYVCTDCGTLESPEWRKGPSGPKTLCNACGLRWAKKEKKKPGQPPHSNSPQVAIGPPIGNF